MQSLLVSGANSIYTEDLSEHGQALNGVLSVELNGINCFVKYELSKTACRVEVHHKLRPQPLSHTFKGINSDTFDVE